LWKLLGKVGLVLCFMAMRERIEGERGLREREREMGNGGKRGI
jgi:hypothetical protein